jgi:hypothetical protein
MRRGLVVAALHGGANRFSEVEVEAPLQGANA